MGINTNPKTFKEFGTDPTTIQADEVPTVGGWFSLYTDGASPGNPGLAGIGAVLYSPGGMIIEELSRYIGPATNNEAEYQGLIDGLLLTMRHGVSKIRIYTDSRLMERQVRGCWEVKSEHLIIYWKRVQGLLRDFSEWEIQWIGREKNAHADALANQGINEYRIKGET